LLADGVDPASATASDIATSAGHLANSVKLGQVLPFDGTPPVRRLAAGDAAAAVVRASDVVGLDHANPTLRFVLPDEGGLLLTDVAVIPRRADNRDGAVRYLDYVCDPDHAAARFRSVPALWPIDGVEARLRRDAPDVAADPRRNPSLDARARLHRFVELSDDGEAELADAFAGVVRAAG
jgi:spermidine/putrescine transport system substrate-binding protein